MNGRESPPSSYKLERGKTQKASINLIENG